MQDVLNSLAQAHELLKAVAVQNIQNNGELEQEISDALKALKALIASFRQVAEA
jgi:hypothetical protein